MANRTLQFYGMAYGDVPVQLNAHINGELVFSGPVATTAGDLPPQPIDISSAPVLFSIADSALYPTSYSGAYPMTVSVATGSGIAIGPVWSNYQQARDSDQVPGTADVFDGCYYGTPTNSEGTVDPRSSVQINGVQQVPPLKKSKGCWTWVVDSGSILECNLNVGPGSE